MSRFSSFCFSPCRHAIKWGLNASYTLRSVLWWGLNIISCVWNILLLYYYITEGKVRQALLNVVTSWNGDLANFPVVFPDTEVLRNMSFAENSESCDWEDISLSGVMFEWSVLCDVSLFNCSWEGLGAMVLSTAAFSYLLLDFRKGCSGCWKRRTAVRVMMVSLMSTVLSCSLVETECNMNPLCSLLKSVL